MELTNHTYLRSRVDMHIADSLRQKASSKIAAGGITDARDNAGGFSAAVRMKSNQYMLQSKRVNIQNSLSFLHAQKEAIENARELVEKIALVKLKFDSPTLNPSDKAHLNKEFMELTEEMIQIKQQSFNGISLFATKVGGSDALYNGVRAELVTGANQAGAAQITKHVIDHEDIRNIYVAGEAVKRGLGGLDIVNFESKGVQEQKEVITITGNIADGDEFSFKINELSQIRELEKTHSVFVKAGAPGTFHSNHAIIKANGASEVEGAANPQEVIADLIVQEINNLASDQDLFVKAEKLGTNQVVITAEGRGDPFELYDVSTNLTTSGFVQSADSHPGNLDTTSQTNQDEIHTLTLDLRDGPAATPGQLTGTIVNKDDTLKITLPEVDPDTNEPTGNTIDITSAGLSAAEAASFDDPVNFEAGAQFLLTKLATAINNARDAGIVNVSADLPANQVNNVGATLQIRSTVRGQTLDAANFNLTPTMGQTLVTATGSTVDLTQTIGRAPKAGDQIRILRYDENADGSGGTFKNYDFQYNAVPTAANEFSTWANLKTAIEAVRENVNDAGGSPVATQVFQVTGTGATMTITDLIPRDIESQKPLRVSQIQLLDGGQVLQVSDANSDAAHTFENRSIWNNKKTTNTTGAGDNNLRVNLTVENDGSLSSQTVGNNAGKNYAVGDNVTVRGNRLDGVNVTNDFTLKVVSVEGKAKTITASAGAKALVASDNYINNGIGHVAGVGDDNFTIDIKAQDNGTIVKADTTIANGGTNYAVNDVITISATDLGGGNAVAGQITVTEIDGGAVGGPGVITDYTWDAGSARNDNVSNITYDNGGAGVTAIGGDGTDLKLSITTDASGGINGISVIDAGTGYNTSGINTVTVSGAQLGNGAAGDQTFTITAIEGEVKTLTWANTAERARISWSHVVSDPSGSGLQLAFDTNRAGDVSNLSIIPGAEGAGFRDGDQITISAANLGGTQPTGSNGDIVIDIDEVEKDFTNAQHGDSSANLGDSFPVKSGTNGSVGDQFIPAAATAVQTAINEIQANRIGEKRVISLDLIEESGAGEIPAGDTFTITMTEVRHPDEISGANAEGTFDGEGARLAHKITASYTTLANDTTDDIRNGLIAAYNTARDNFLDDNGDGSLTALDTDGIKRKFDIPEISGANNTLTFTSFSAGEDFNVSIGLNDDPESLAATGGLNDPRGILSHQKNISPFSITQALEFFQNMLSQNAAETSRLMKSQEYLENSIVNTEQAWGKLNDTDYTNASTEQVRESMKVQMANNIIGKSIRMSDLLIDLTTKHHRGAMLNARA